MVVATTSVGIQCRNPQVCFLDDSGIGMLLFFGCVKQKYVRLTKHNKIGRIFFNKNQRSIYKSKEIVAIFLCISCYGFAIVMMDNVWQYVTQLFEHIMSPKSLSMAYCTYGLNQFFYGLNHFFF